VLLDVGPKDFRAFARARWSTARSLLGIVPSSLYASDFLILAAAPVRGL
jgi:hypothetical protein